ncbi:unnamed protein product [Withania somnifera]
MTTLEISSYSFRRQGSSGHIWDNRLNKSAGGDIQFDKVSNVATKSVGMKINENAYAATPTSRSESKPQKCSVIAFFGRCAKTPAT